MSEYSHHIIECLLYILGTSEFFRITHVFRLCVWLSYIVMYIISENKAEKKKKNHNIVKPGTKPKSNIKSMFMAQAAGGSKKKQEVCIAVLLT